MGPREGLCSCPNGIRVDQRIARVIAIVLETGAFRVWCAMSAHEAGKGCDKCIDCSLGRVTVRQRIGLSLWRKSKACESTEPFTALATLSTSACQSAGAIQRNSPTSFEENELVTLRESGMVV